MEVPVDAGDQYNLKWNNHLINFIQTFVENQLTENLVDVTLSCEGQHIKTHKLILSACSDYFNGIFQLHNNVQHPIIVLHGVRYVDLKYILCFMYHGEVKVADKDLPNVLALGETLQIKGLSSVKMRDLPREDVSEKAPKKVLKKDNNMKTNNVPKETQVHSVRTENKAFSNTMSKPIMDYSRKKGSSRPNILKSHGNKSEVPVITSVISEAPLDPLNISPGSSTKSRDISTTMNNTNIPIPKPPHAFIIFANEWRKKLMVEHPEENNKEISVRLGIMWKNLLPETKNIYYREAKRAEEEYKVKNQGFISLSDCLKRKADVLNDTTNHSASLKASLDPMEVVEIQEHIAVSDSD